MNETEIVDRQAAKIANIAAEVEGRLAEQQPILDAAIKAVDVIKRDDITYVKGLASPNEKIVLVMRCVLVYLETPKKKWEEIQKEIQKLDLKTLKEKCEKAELIPDKVVKSALNVMKDKLWNIESFKGVHPLCVNLGTWCEEIAKCSKIKKQVVPIQKELDIKNQEKDEAVAKLKVQ